MTKKIVLTSCEGCPHKDHRGGYGNPSYVPVCRNVNKNLGFKREVNSRGTGVTAVYDGKIPSWCPLQNELPTYEKAITIGDFLKLPNAYVISIDGDNIGHTAVLENVKDDDIHFIGVDEIVTFTYKTEFLERLYVFSTDSLIYITRDNFSKTPYCQHLYTLENISGEKVNVELGFVSQIYNLKNAKGLSHE